jgi:single-stranded-DNA-specific exonuclease
MHWQIKKKISKTKSSERREEILNTLLADRGIKGKKNRENFFNPQKPDTLTPKQVNINSRELKKAIKRIKKALKDKEAIVVYGDYDADGICATAILWETLHAIGAKALPFIPHRERHGYGLTVKGIEEILGDPEYSIQGKQPSLIITVDNGIVAFAAARFAKKKGIDLIISDHHVKAKKVPYSTAIIHSTDLAGSGVAWIFAKEISKKFKTNLSVHDSLDLVTIGTLADMVPLLVSNRSIVKHGIKKLRKTSRVGLIKMLENAAINPLKIDPYHINFIIAPRINAMGRLEHGFDSLRLLCTKNHERAAILARKIGETNRRRQQLTEELLEMAKSVYYSQKKTDLQEKIIIIEHSEFHEGVIGLIAGKMVEEFYRPTIVLTSGKEFMKASARSVSGFNIIEAIRESEEYLVDAGGHPMAAGFTIESEKINLFKTSIRKTVEKKIRKDLLEKKLRVDCQIELADISWKLYKEISKFEPFGIGNKRPIFALKNIKVLESRAIGSDAKHLKLFLPSNIPTQPNLPALWFGKGEIASQIPKEVSIAFTLNENIWKNKRELQLMIKSILAN